MFEVTENRVGPATLTVDEKEWLEMAAKGKKKKKQTRKPKPKRGY